MTSLSITETLMNNYVGIILLNSIFYIKTEIDNTLSLHPPTIQILSIFL